MRRPDSADGARIAILAGVFAVAFAGLTLRAGQVALSGADEFRAVAGEAAPALGRRGDIVDRNGEILASTLSTYSLFADPKLVWNAEETAAALRAALPDLDVAETARKLASNKRFVWIRRGLGPRQRQAVFDMGLPGLDFREEPRRIYPRGRLAAHALGFTTIDGVGAAGAEKAYDAELSAGDGRPLALSIDLRVQYAVDEELRAGLEEFNAKAAVALVTDVDTGEVLALVSLPDFDPNLPAESSPDGRLNRALASVYELGSIFKTFTLAMAIDTGAADPARILPTDQPVIAGDVVIAEHAPAPRRLSVGEVFVRSSNPGAAYLALEAGGAVQRDYLQRFGLMERAPSPFAESARPILPQTWDEIAVATVAYGHGVAVSPLAFAGAFGAVVNGGEYVRPTLRPVGPRGALADRVIESGTSHVMNGLLRAVVLEGTGGRADVPGLAVGGKTGTAEKAVAGGYAPDRVAASFAAVFPADAPRYAVFVVLDEPQGADDAPGRRGAGHTAAPVAGRVIARIAPLLGVARRDETTAAAFGARGG